ncbi:MAG: hypothetical protein IH866_01145 [Chloroflexi bacterium]|nr:hypothetical protein [Chloroflexota bacterium]
MTTIQLPNADAKLVYLALQYHLARPGSELDAQSKRPKEHGLAAIAEELERQLPLAVATIDMNNEQRRQLDEALSGAINQVKSSALLADRGRSMVPSFDAALRRLFPEVADEPENALPLAGELLALRRRLARSVVPPDDAPLPPSKRPWWRPWGRG